MQKYSMFPAIRTIFPTISAAIAHIPAADQTPTVIEIEPGIYHEKLTIDKP